MSASTIPLAGEVVEASHLLGADDARAMDAFASLGQRTRLAMFRLLVARAPAGIAVGDIGVAMDCPQNTASGHLAILARAQLVTSARNGRSVVYRADLEGVRWLLEYLLADCCNGDPSVCEVAFSSLCTGSCTPLSQT
jgi:ArsR family transcriptional regulator